MRAGCSNASRPLPSDEKKKILGRLPGSQGQNLALTVLYVPYPLDIGLPKPWGDAWRQSRRISKRLSFPGKAQHAPCSPPTPSLDQSPSFHTGLFHWKSLERHSTHQEKGWGACCASPHGFVRPMSSEYGTYKTVNAPCSRPSPSLDPSSRPPRRSSRSRAACTSLACERPLEPSRCPL